MFVCRNFLPYTTTQRHNDTTTQRPTDTTTQRHTDTAAAVAAAAAASDAACVGVPAALGRSWTAPAPLLGALGQIPRF